MLKYFQCSTFLTSVPVCSPSTNLSGNRAHALKNSAGKVDEQHVATYDASDLRTREDILLSRGGLILIGILRGGDYHQAGLAGCGVTIAHGLAKCGFGDSLLKAARTMDKKQLEGFLAGWREQVREELKSNSKGFIGRKNPSLAKSMPNDFPDVDIVLSYTAPITSETKGGIDPSRFNWTKEPDIGKIAGICELYFEWGVKDVIIKRFRTVIWPSVVLRVLRRSALIADDKERLQHRSEAMPGTPSKKRGIQPIGTPSKMITDHFLSLTLVSSDKRHDVGDEGDNNLVVKIHSSRTHPSTDNILEYRLEIAPAHLIRLAESGIRGLRTDILKNPMDTAEAEAEDLMLDEEESKTPVDPLTHFRVWMPACMVELAEPELVAEFQAKEQAKLEKKRAPKSTVRKGKAVTTKVAPVPRRKKKAANPSVESSDEEISDGDVLPVLPLDASRVAGTLAPHTVDTSGRKPFDNPTALKIQEEKKKREENAIKIDNFFKASRGPASVKASSSNTSTSKVASLFDNIVVPNTHHISTRTDVHKLAPRSQRSSAAPSGRTTAASSSVPSRAQSILDFLDGSVYPDLPATSTSSTTRSHAGRTAASVLQSHQLQCFRIRRI